MRLALSTLAVAALPGALAESDRAKSATFADKFLTQYCNDVSKNSQDADTSSSSTSDSQANKAAELLAASDAIFPPKDIKKVLVFVRHG